MTDTKNRKVTTMKLTGKSTSRGDISFKSRAYFSAYHFWAAKHFLDLATKIEENGKDEPVFSIEHRAYVHNSVLSSVAFLDAAINELFQDAHDEHQSYIKGLDAQIIKELAKHWADTELKRKYEKTLQKYQQALIIAGKEAMIEGQTPFQDAYLVVLLRNFLTHYKPKSIGGDVTHKLEDKLRGKFPLNIKYKKYGNEDFPDKMLGMGCARWSLKSVKNFADEFFIRIDVQPNY